MIQFVSMLTAPQIISIDKRNSQHIVPIVTTNYSTPISMKLIKVFVPNVTGKKSLGCVHIDKVHLQLDTKHRLKYQIDKVL